MIHEPRGQRILTLAAALADPVSGTVPNRFASQAAIGRPLGMCGGGTWARGIIGICDTVRCIQLAC
jgi:UDP-sulfoquinovose synthase